MKFDLCGKPAIEQLVIWQLAFSPDGQTIASASAESGFIELWLRSRGRLFTDEYDFRGKRSPVVRS